MIAPPLPPNESDRLQSLHRLGLLDSKAEERFDRLTRIAARMFRVPIAYISLMDENRQWFKSCFGTETKETSRKVSFCGHAILANQPFIIADATKDLRFYDNPLVLGPPHIRFYAGIPLASEDGMLVGTLCLVDQCPRELDEEELKLFQDIALIVRDEINFLGSRQLTGLLRKSEERFLSAFELASIGMGLVSPEGRWQKANRALCELLGFTEEELCSRTFQDITHPDDLKICLESVRKILAGEIPSYHMEKRYFHRKGHPVWVQLSVSLVRDLENKPQYFIAQVQDISVRKQAESELIWKTAFLEAQVNSSADGMLVVDGKGKKILQNQKVRQLWNIPKIISDDPDDEKTQLRWVTNATKDPLNFSDRIKYLNANPNEIAQDEIELIDGKVLDRYSSPVRGKDGIHYGRIWTFRDITQRKTAERELVRIQKEHESVLSAIGDGVHWIGLDGLIKFENESGAAMLGYEPAELIGKSVYQVMYPIQADGNAFPLSECPVYATLRDGLVRRVQNKIFWRKDGTSFDVEYTCTPTHDESVGANGCVITFVDVTKRKRFESDLEDARTAAETASRSKTEFLANMSHEIRTPLNGIIGMTDLMNGTSLSAEQKDFLETIHASGENLLTIVNDVLDFSKIEFGKLELDYHAFNLLDLIDDVVCLLSFRMTKKNLEFVAVLQQDLPIEYLGDATRIRQVLINLVTNAIKFTKEGQITLELCAGTQATPMGKQQILFRICDTGIGIRADRLDRLFKVFSQVDTSTTRRYGGSGLGLAICQKLVEIMGGNIKVESVPDKGSIFSFEIPLDRATQEEGTVRDGGELTGRRVLIIDDVETNRRMLTLQLARWGVSWVDVSTGEEALNLLRKGERFDAALIDFQMPDTDGIMVAREISRVIKDPLLPLILISSQTGDISMEEFKKAGFSAVLAKPVRQKLLCSTLLQAFRAPAKRSETVVLLGSDKRATESLNILTVEDNFTNQKVAQQILKRIGYETDLANNGCEAILAVGRKAYDLIFMDIHMPELDGLEATREIRRKHSLYGSPMIVALTADVLKGEREVCLQAGMDGYLTKPIKIDALKEVIENLFALRKVKTSIRGVSAGVA